MVQRSRQPPSLSRFAKNSLDVTLHPQIDATLKQLKTCARSLQSVLSTFSNELQILHRIHYKGKNQHRSALFWRRVAEMRRYGDRVEELSLLSLVDSLRYSFFAEEAQQNSKLLKGSWTHYPGPSTVSYVHERITGSITLVQKMQERLTHVYQSFSLAMQTGAFIQLILTLAGIASRMSSLISELLPILEQVRDAVYRILLALDPEVPPHDDSRSRRALPDQSSSMLASVKTSIDVCEDTGVSIVRQDPQPAALPSPPNGCIDTAVVRDALSYDIPALAAVNSVEVVTKKAKRSPSERDPKQLKPKKKRKRDEIDDIFG
ncbi:DUF4477 domain-containing protein [Mycena venus]|uniref:DUF4477 domain-containing protein n=1 Tax=Mycena venus TaxID=2733690 RepID=A0A8H6XD02_9AGAR|nr:DUF4477 domain-containing protein [Mycena venus]